MDLINMLTELHEEADRIYKAIAVIERLVRERTTISELSRGGARCAATPAHRPEGQTKES